MKIRIKETTLGLENRIWLDALRNMLGIIMELWKLRQGGLGTEVDKSASRTDVKSQNKPYWNIPITSYCLDRSLSSIFFTGSQIIPLFSFKIPYQPPTALWMKFTGLDLPSWFHLLASPLACFTPTTLTSFCYIYFTKFNFSLMSFQNNFIFSVDDVIIKKILNKSLLSPGFHGLGK